MGSSRSAENRAKDFSISWPIKCSGWRARKPLVARVSRRSTTPNTSLNMSAMSMSATLAVGKVSLTSKCVASRVTARESVAIGPALFRAIVARCRHPRVCAGTPPRAARRTSGRAPDAKTISYLVFSQAPPQGAGCQVQVRLLARFRATVEANIPDAMAFFWSVGGLSRNHRDARRWARDGRRADHVGLHPDRASSPVIAAVRTPPRALALPLAPRSRLFLTRNLASALRSRSLELPIPPLRSSVCRVAAETSTRKPGLSSAAVPRGRKAAGKDAGAAARTAASSALPRDRAPATGGPTAG